MPNPEAELYFVFSGISDSDSDSDITQSFQSVRCQVSNIFQTLSQIPQLLQLTRCCGLIYGTSRTPFLKC